MVQELMPRDVSWRGGYPDWERICRAPGSKVLPDARIAGRDARHIRCGDYTGRSWQLWIDRRTGLVLKVVGEVGGHDHFTDVPSTSAKGGFQVVKLSYHPSFPAGMFKVAAPPGALDLQGRLQAAEAKVPPFRAVVSGRFHRKSSVEEVWWLNSQTWREKVLAGDAPGDGLAGAGSFAVADYGNQVVSYSAADNSYSRSGLSQSAIPIRELLPEGAVYGYSAARCPIVGHGRIAGRDVVHRRCAGSDI
jgi:hypothetical protein